jgi:predicted peroxiredoxin
VSVLYIAATGAGNPTRASIPLHVAANGSIETGQECAVVLVGDGVELAVQAQAETVEGVGILPARDLFAKLLEHGVPVYT